LKIFSKWNIINAIIPYPKTPRTGVENRKGGFALLQAKLHAPTINKNIISREKLLAKLQYAKEGKLTLVMAPAGYGKTTAVLDWLGKCGLPFAWLSLSERDNHYKTFWEYICATLDGIADGISKETEYVFSSREMMDAGVHLNILIDRLSERSSDFLLVLDDLHLIKDPSILAGLSYLIDFLPPKMHLIFISRTEPELDLSRHRIKWQIQRLETEDLRFSEDEILRFYQSKGVTLENDELKAVESHTDGWIAALVAAALSMEDGGGHSAIEALPRSGRDIDRYLRDEVFAAWAPQKQSFAMKTSILDTLSEDLCNAVTGDCNGGRLLRGIYETSGFVLDMDGQQQSFRYHHLFASFLREMLQENAPEEIPQLYMRAGFWFQEQGSMPEAIEYFLNGGAYEQAYELIEHRIDYLIHKNDFGRLLSWLERLPAEYRDNSLKSAAIYALYYAEIGRYDLSRQWIDRIKALRDDARYASVPSWEATSSRYFIMTEANLLIRQGDTALLSLISFASSSEGFRNYKMPEYNDFNTADIYFYRCPLNKLKDLLREAPEKYGTVVEDYRKLISKNPGYAPLAMGEYLYENNRLEEALPYLLKAREEAREANCPGALVPAMVDIARIKRAGRDISGAFAVLEECEKQLWGAGKPHWNYLLHAFRCRLLIDAGDTEQAQEWLSSSKLGIFTELGRIREFELIVYARVLILMNRAQDAELLLQRLLTFSGDNRRLHSRVEVLNLLALLAFRYHQMRRAYDYLEESLDIGMTEGYLRSYLDELFPMTQLLRAYIKARGKRSEDDHSEKLALYAALLLKQMHGSMFQTPEARDTAAAKDTKSILSQLTEQEKKVLELLVGAATNKEIGEKLGISLRTVKTHTGNIYGKLGVKNRAQCVKLVRESMP
jgi:LuxR family maltose regulon positive regulatory protein